MARQTILQRVQRDIACKERTIADKRASITFLISRGDYDEAMSQAEALGAMLASLVEDVRSFNIMKILVERRYMAGSGH